MSKCENAMKLLDNGWAILLFRDGLKQYSALAIKPGASVDDELENWKEEDRPHPFVGMNKYCSCGFTVEESINAVVEKVLFDRLPGMTAEECRKGLDEEKS